MDKKLLVKELKFKAVRSGGSGGQHVNKVATKVALSFDVGNSHALSREEKYRIQGRLDTRIANDGMLTLFSDSTRSQHRNKELVIARFLKLLDGALKKPKKRKKTKPPKAAVEKRLKSKKKASEKKESRKKPNFD